MVSGRRAPGLIHITTDLERLATSPHTRYALRMSVTLVGVICLILGAAMAALGTSQLATGHGVTVSTHTTRGKTATLVEAPPAAVNNDARAGVAATRPATSSGARPLRASYTPNGVRLSGLGFSFGLSTPTVGRGVAKIGLATKLVHRSDAATYGSGGLTENFHPVSSDIEQTFHIAHKAHGAGPLTIDIPISGLTAVNSGSSIELRNGAGHVEVTYSGLRVADAKDKSVPATMAASSGGSAIKITVQDAHAAYPLTVDPTWSNPLVDVYVGGTGSIEAVDPNTGSVSFGSAYCHYCSMAFAPGGTTAFTLYWTNITYEGQSTAVPFNPITGSVGPAIDVAQEPDSVVISPNGLTAYVTSANYGQGYIYAISTVTDTIQNTYYVGGAYGSVITPDGRTLWVAGASGSQNYLVSINLATGAQSQEIPLPEGTFDQLTMSPNGQTLYGIGQTNVLPISLPSGTAGTPISASAHYYPTSFGISPDGTMGYTVEGSSITPINLVSGTAGTPISLAGLPNGAGTGLVGISVGANGQGWVLSNGDYSRGTQSYVTPVNLSTGAPGTPINTELGTSAYVLYQAPPPSNVAPNATATEDAMVHSPGCQHHNTASDPVDCASGDFFHTFTDVSVPGYGPALDLTRTYNSLEASAEGIFGYGWSSSYDSHLVVNGDGSITITEGDGSQVTATPNGSGGFTVPSWADSTLTSSGGTYTFVRQQGQTFTFNSSGQLTSIVDPSGATTSLAYASGKLHTVTDPSSRTLTFAFGTNGLVSSVTDPMSRQTTYAYDASGNLTSVTDPLSRVTSFGYGTGASVHLMLTMTMPNGQTGGPDAGEYYANTYDSNGRVLTQTDPKGQETTYSYSGDNYSDSGGTTTITDPDGNVETESYVDGQLQTVVRGTVDVDLCLRSEHLRRDIFGRSQRQQHHQHLRPFGQPSHQHQRARQHQDLLVQRLQRADLCRRAARREPLLVAHSAVCGQSRRNDHPAGVGTAQVRHLHLVRHQRERALPDDRRLRAGLRNGLSVAHHLRPLQRQLGDARRHERLLHDLCALHRASLRHDRPGRGRHPAHLRLRRRPHLESTPDGNSGGQMAKTTYGYDTDGEQTSIVAPDGNLSGANAGELHDDQDLRRRRRADLARRWAAARARPSCPG